MRTYLLEKQTTRTNLTPQKHRTKRVTQSILTAQTILIMLSMLFLIVVDGLAQDTPVCQMERLDRGAVAVKRVPW